MEPVEDAEARVAVTLLGLPGTCWRCGEQVVPLVGVLVTDDRGARFFEFSEVAGRLVETVSPEKLRSLGVGAIKRRRSRVRPDGYLSNGCVHCDAILGDHPLREDLISFQAEGGDLEELAIATVVVPRRGRP